MKRILLITLTALVVTACNPFKVTDPKHPDFDVSKFKFEDYKNAVELQKAINKIFPKGAVKNDVDAILVEKLGSSTSAKNPDEGWQLYYYTNFWNYIGRFLSPGSTNFGSFKIYIYYDEEDAVEKICVNSVDCKI
ncbi:lipoprotein [Roseibium sp. MB-4]